jgi:P2 family phage contractile tail tube protein
MAEIPLKVKDFSLFVEARGYAGLVEEITLPNVTHKTQEIDVGGLSGTMRYKMKLEAMEAQFKFATWEGSIFQIIGASQNEKLRVIARGSLERHETVIPVTIVLNGAISSIEPSALSVSGETSLMMKMEVEYYKFTRGIEKLIEVDILNNVLDVGGVDLLADRRRALLI